MREPGARTRFRESLQDPGNAKQHPTSGQMAVPGAPPCPVLAGPAPSARSGSADRHCRRRGDGSGRPWAGAADGGRSRRDGAHVRTLRTRLVNQVCGRVPPPRRRCRAGWQRTILPRRRRRALAGCAFAKTMPTGIRHTIPGRRATQHESARGRSLEESRAVLRRGHARAAHRASSGGAPTSRCSGRRCSIRPAGMRTWDIATASP